MRTSLLTPYRNRAIRNSLAAGTESLSRLLARTSGASPHDDGCQNEPCDSFRRISLMPMLAASGSCHHRESVAIPCGRPVPLMSLAPSGSCTHTVSVAVTSSIHSCPWAVREDRHRTGKPVQNLRLRATWASAGCSTLRVCRNQILRPVRGLYPPGCCGPPGISPETEPAAASSGVTQAVWTASGLCSQFRSAFTRPERDKSLTDPAFNKLKT